MEADILKILMVVILNVFAYMTIRLRPKLFGVKLFKPMIWNFKLSVLPFFLGIGSFISFIGFRYLETITGLKVFGYLAVLLAVLGCISWILTLPNSNYLITELNFTHRGEDEREVPIWYDIVSLMSLALSGILNTVININIVQYIYLIMKDPNMIGRKDRYIFISSAIIINIFMSVGIYIGRYIRFNSWDILKPISFLKSLMTYFSNREKIKDFFLFLLCHSTFFIIIYFLFNTNNIFLN